MRTPRRRMSRSCLSTVFLPIASALTFCPAPQPRERASAAFKGIWTKLFRCAISGEFLATLICVLLGLGSTVDWASGTEKPSPADLVLVSLCFSLGVATVVQCFLPFSSCHINPVGKLSLAKALFYVTAQCLGAIAAAGLLYLLTPSAVRGNLGVTNVNLDISVGHALLVELLITFELLFTVMATCNAKRADLTGSASLAIGLAVVIGHLFAVICKVPFWNGSYMCMKQPSIVALSTVPDTVYRGRNEPSPLLWTCTPNLELGTPLGVPAHTQALKPDPPTPTNLRLLIIE
ncbi:hypothetical protein P4O66_008703 [Electrophorus voltai]|uniref:Aquaporin 4 n=1 Tax=Electrophorus voltai TaxID=2609070 RepID=A0AAD8ZDF0_9TELE|nr:hypothetical protein P4O66_008703 [Electrophorus voltai]